MKKFSWDKNKIYLMGIVNVTPDSFSDGGKYLNEKKAISHAQKLIKQGANIIDIGGESTRPGAKKVNSKEELKRVIPVIKKLSSYIKKNKLDVLISIDTTKSIVAKKAIEVGANIVNDVSAMEIDPEIANVVSQNGVGIILMHMKGKPRNMQKNPQYKNVTKEIITYLKSRIIIARSKGINKSQIAIDPGIGFGKTVENNLEILANLEKFKKLGCPILIGTSRKSFIGKILNKKEDERIFGTAATTTISLMKGVTIFRVHDVYEMNDVIKITKAIKEI